MNILLFDFGSFTQEDLIFYLERAGHHCKNILYKLPNFYKDDFFEYRFEKYLIEGKFDCVMSINFHPIVAQICYRRNTKYISWSYDSPISNNFEPYFSYPTNYIFLFDRLEAEEFRSKGFENIYHLPLAVNMNRTANLSISSLEKEAYSCDISFIGQFYHSALKDLLYLLGDYEKGQIQAIVDSQLQIYGYNFVNECATQKLVDKMNATYDRYNLKIVDIDSDRLTTRSLAHSINKEVTHTERLALLSLLSKRYDVNYYSTETPEILKNVMFCGSAHYFSEMPKIFNLSKINLNITLRSIRSGIPLRALDIMGAKGFLLSNYQPEFWDYFTPDENIVLYEDIPDALMKADYYMSHPEERQRIIQNCLPILKESFNYESRIQDMFAIAGLL